MKKNVILIGLLAAGLVARADVLLFTDSFDRAAGTNVNDGAAANQSGTVAPLSYGVFANNTPATAAISGNKVKLNADGSGQNRLALQYDFSDQAATIVSAGKFEVSYSVRGGVDYTNTTHGSYSSSLILSQKSTVESASIGGGNIAQGLFVKIQGNGQVTAYSQGTTLLSKVNSNYDNAYVIGGTNNVRVVVDTDGFTTTVTNNFSLYINNALVGSADFKWKTANDLSVGLEAGEYSAEFDNLKIQSIPEPATMGLFVISSGLILVLRRIHC